MSELRFWCRRPSGYASAIAAVSLGLTIATQASGQAAGVLGLPLRNGPVRLTARRVLERAAANARGEMERERSISVPKLVRGNPRRREIALTFDDGPHGALTLRLLDILRQEKVRATFFLVGRMVDRYPEIARRIAADGHEIANHTYDHLRLASVPPSLIEPQLREGSRAIERAVGAPTRLFRPPGGEYNADVLEVARRLRYTMVLWTNDPGDFAMPGSATIEQRTLKGVSPGAIVLLHDGILQTYDILPGLIRRLKAQGYRFVTISEMALDPGAICTGGPSVPLRRPFAGAPPRTALPASPTRGAR